MHLVLQPLGAAQMASSTGAAQMASSGKRGRSGSDRNDRRVTRRRDGDEPDDNQDQQPMRFLRQIIEVFTDYPMNIRRSHGPWLGPITCCWTASASRSARGFVQVTCRHPQCPLCFVCAPGAVGAFEYGAPDVQQSALTSPCCPHLSPMLGRDFSVQVLRIHAFCTRLIVRTGLGQMRLRARFMMW